MLEAWKCQLYEPREVGLHHVVYFGRGFVCELPPTYALADEEWSTLLRSKLGNTICCIPFMISWLGALLHGSTSGENYAAPGLGSFRVAIPFYLGETPSIYRPSYVALSSMALFFVPES